MATMNSGVLACNYAVSSGIGSLEFNLKPTSVSTAAAGYKLPIIKATNQSVKSEGESPRQQQGRRAALLCLGAALFATATSSAANAGVIDEYLEKSKANKELNDQKRLATSGANFARAYTVQFGTCTFPYNFTGCQDLAKQKGVCKFERLNLAVKGANEVRSPCEAVLVATGVRSPVWTPHSKQSQNIID